MSKKGQKQRLKMGAVKNDLHRFSAGSSDNSEAWAEEIAAKVNRGNILTIFKGIVPSLESDELELEISGIAVVFLRDDEFSIAYVIDSDAYEMSFLQTTLAAFAGETAQKGQLFCCAISALKKPLTEQQIAELAQMETTYGESGKRKAKNNNSADPLCHFLSKLGISLEGGLEKETLSIEEVALALLSDSAPPEKLASIREVFFTNDSSASEPSTGQSTIPKLSDLLSELGAPSAAGAVNEKQKDIADEPTNLEQTSVTPQTEHAPASQIKLPSLSDLLSDEPAVKADSSDKKSPSLSELLTDSKPQGEDAKGAEADLSSSIKLPKQSDLLADAASDTEDKSKTETSVSSESTSPGKLPKLSDLLADDATALAKTESKPEPAAEPVAPIKLPKLSDLLADDATALAKTESKPEPAAEPVAPIKLPKLSDLLADDATALAKTESKPEPAAEPAAPTKLPQLSDLLADEATAAKDETAAAKEIAREELPAAQPVSSLRLSDLLSDEEPPAKEQAKAVPLAKTESAIEEEESAPSSLLKSDGESQAHVAEIKKPPAEISDTGLIKNPKRPTLADFLSEIKNSEEKQASLAMDQIKNQQKQQTKVPVAPQEQSDLPKDKVIAESTSSNSTPAKAKVNEGPSAEQTLAKQAEQEDTDRQTAGGIDIRNSLIVKNTLAKLEDQQRRTYQRIDEFVQEHKNACSRELTRLRQQSFSVEPQEFLERVSYTRKTVVRKLRLLSIEADEKLGSIILEGRKELERWQSEGGQELQTKIDLEQFTSRHDAALNEAKSVAESYCKEIKSLVPLQTIIDQVEKSLSVWREKELSSCRNLAEQILAQVQERTDSGISALQAAFDGMCADIERIIEFDLERITLLQSELEDIQKQACAALEMRISRYCDMALAHEVLPMLCEFKNSFLMTANEMGQTYANDLEELSRDGISSFARFQNLASDNMAEIKAKIVALKQEVDIREKRDVDQAIEELSEYLDQRLEKLSIDSAAIEPKKPKDSMRQNIERGKQVENIANQYHGKIDQSYERLQTRTNKRLSEIIDSVRDKSAEEYAAFSQMIKTQVQTYKSKREKSLNDLEQRLAAVSKQTENYLDA